MDIVKDNQMYMRIAQIAAERSYAKRLKVGCVIVKNHSIISFGWNGMPTGYDNCCEMEVDGKLVTRPEVQHAELNAIAKLAENGYSSKDAAIFITHSPCIHCALLIQKCGISQVFYHELYRSREGLDFLERAGIKVTQLYFFARFSAKRSTCLASSPFKSLAALDLFFGLEYPAVQGTADGQRGTCRFASLTNMRAEFLALGH